MHVLLLLLPHAYALCLDTEPDNFCAPSTGPDEDCDDNNASVRPDAQEVIGDGQDQDCDGHDALERFYVASNFSSWSKSAGVVATPDTVNIPNSGWIVKISNTDAFRGQMYVVVSAAVTGANCSMEVETRSSSPMVTDGFVLASGVNAYHLTNASALPSPGTRKISRVKFTCDATASMALDWFSIQNAASVVFPPSADVQVVWDDLDITGGGRHNAVRQSLSGMMYAASDGGIGIWDPLVSTDEWHFASGFGASGIPSYQRYISDVAGVDWNADGVDEVFALSGETVIDAGGGADTIGGLWRSDDQGETWDPVEDSFGASGHVAPAYDDDTSPCPGGGDINGGGHKLLADETNEVLYVASHREHSVYGSSTAREDVVLMWDQLTGGMCTPNFDLPLDQTLSALAFAEGVTDGVPMLLVGYRAPGSTNSGLYACDVGDPFGGPDVTCATTGSIVCSPVAASEGWDVRDIEVDPDTGLVYVSTGRADDVSCMASAGQVFELDFDTFDLTEVDAGAADLSTTWATDFGFGDRDVTGVSLDPTGTFLYAVVPGTEQGILQLDLADTTLSWDRIGENQYERPAKRAMMDTGYGWLGGTELVRESYVPEVRDTISPIDLLWFTSWDEEIVDGVPVDTTATHALLLGWRTLWDIYGIDEADSGLYHPAYESEWALTPRVDNWWSHTTWGTVGPVDLEPDADGNVWMATPEQLGLLAWSDPPPLTTPPRGAEQDCLFERYDADGSSVSVGMDGSVWVSLVDTGGGTPQDIGIWKRTIDTVWVEPEGLGGFWATVPQWWFQGGGWDMEGSNALVERVTIETLGQYNDVLCEWPIEDYVDESDPYATAWGSGMYNGPVAKSLGTESGIASDPNGALFVDQVLDRSGDSWGNPRVVAALDGNIAVAAFATYLNLTGTEVSGRLAYTIDGGHNWTWIDTEVETVAVTYDAGCGDMAEFYDDSMSLVMLGRGRDSYWDDADADGVVDAGEWALRLMVGSSGSSTAGCMMAKVLVDDADAVWDWHVNTPTADAAGCRVTQAGFDGLTGTDWSDEVFFWGGYTAECPGATPNGWLEYGGVCALDLDTGAITSVISPSTSERTYEYQFADVAASPNVSDLLLVTGRMTPASMIECREPVGAGPLSNAFCPSSTPPLLVTRDASGTWQSVPLRDVPPTDAGLAVSWATGESERLYLSTENAGAWKGSVTW